MATKPTSTFKKYQLINLSLALGFLSSMAMKETTIIYDFVAERSEFDSNVRTSQQCLGCLPELVAALCGSVALLRFTKLMDWLTFNRLTQWAFLIANTALMIEMASFLLYGRPSYLMRVYFEAPWKIGLMIGGVSLIGCTVWYQGIKRHSFIRNRLAKMLAAY
jgi:hypothetical protein